MADLRSGSQVYVVVESYIDGHRPVDVVHGVYSNETLARIAAYHPHSSLKVLRLYLDVTPVDEADDLDAPRAVTAQQESGPEPDQNGS